MYKIAKEFQFDACHMLDGHNGKCHNLHGHTYRLIIEISANLIEQGSSADMVMDFADIKQTVKQHVIDKLDHASKVGNQCCAYPAIATTSAIPVITQQNQ